MVLVASINLTLATQIGQIRERICQWAFCQLEDGCLPQRFLS